MHRRECLRNNDDQNTMKKRLRCIYFESRINLKIMTLKKILDRIDDARTFHRNPKKFQTEQLMNERYWYLFAHSLFGIRAWIVFGDMELLRSCWKWKFKDIVYWRLCASINAYARFANHKLHNCDGHIIYILFVFLFYILFCSFVTINQQLINV